MKKPIPNWETDYLAGEDGCIYSQKTGKQMYTVKDKNGYLIVQLFNSELKKRYTVAVHRLIAKTFLGQKIISTDTINHIDGNKLNNQPNNLEYTNRSEQMYHAYKLGLKKPVRNSNQKLSDEQVIEIQKRYKLGGRGNGSFSIAKSYNVSETCILNIVNGRTYNWVTEGATTSQKA